MSLDIVSVNPYQIAAKGVQLLSSRGVTRDLGVAGSSLTWGTVLCPWARPLILCLEDDLSRHDWKNVDWDIENQNKQMIADKWKQSYQGSDYIPYHNYLLHTSLSCHKGSFEFKDNYFETTTSLVDSKQDYMYVSLFYWIGILLCT